MVGELTLSHARAISLDAARDLYLQEGLAGVTMRGVAQHIGVTVTSL